MKVTVSSPHGDAPGEIIEIAKQDVLVNWRRPDRPDDARADWFSKQTLIRNSDLEGSRYVTTIKPSPKRILITGAAGFLGRQLATSLHVQGHAVHGFDAAGEPTSSFPVHVERGLIYNSAAITETLGRVKPEVIYHLAAMSHVGECHRDPMMAYRVNVGGTQTLLDWVRIRCPEARVLIAGSGEEYGTGGKLTEHDGLFPNNIYGASKAAATALAMGYGAAYGLDVSVVRMANLYGPGQDKSKFIPLVIDRLLRGETVQLHDHGRPIRDWLYVGDAVEALRMFAIDRKGEPGGDVINLPGATHETIGETAERIATLLDEAENSSDAPHSSGLRYVEGGAKVAMTIMSGDYARELGWTPRTDFDTGLRRTIKYYL